MDEEKNLSGLGGWLILVAIGLIFHFILIGYGFFNELNTIFFSGAWSLLCDPNSNMYVANFDWLISFEFICNSVYLILNGYVIYLFFRKNYKFPSFFIFFKITYVVFIISDVILCCIVLQFARDYSPDLKGIFRSIIYVCIWVPYMLTSVRVKNTFINGRRSEPSYNGIVS